MTNDEKLAAVKAKLAIVRLAQSDIHLTKIRLEGLKCYQALLLDEQQKLETLRDGGMPSEQWVNSIIGRVNGAREVGGHIVLGAFDLGQMHKLLKQRAPTQADKVLEEVLYG